MPLLLLLLLLLIQINVNVMRINSKHERRAESQSHNPISSLTDARIVLRLLAASRYE
jgi:hypothetical protein